MSKGQNLYANELGAKAQRLRFCSLCCGNCRRQQNRICRRGGRTKQLIIISVIVFAKVPNVAKKKFWRNIEKPCKIARGLEP